MRSRAHLRLIASLLLACVPAHAAERDARTGERLLPVAVIESLAMPAATPRGAAALRVTYPAVRRRFPIVVLSQGARSTPAMYDYLARHWAGRGHVVLQPIPPELSPLATDSRTGSAVRLPATIEARIADIRLTLSQLAEIEAREGALRGRLDHERIALAGHSTGALASLLAAGAHLTFVAASGGSAQPIGADFAAARIDALLLVGDPERSGIAPEGAWRAVDVPTLLVTGDLDAGEAPGGGRKPETLFAVRQPGIAAAHELFVRGMDVCLGGLLCSVAPGTTPDPAAQAGIAEITTAFLQASLRGDAKAVEWLASDAPAETANGRATLKVHR